ncbi:MAG: SGNH/GDSL hydrolase family protein [Deltaproteobacteria bacterium]|nr:SGNH/GDSL hydrolase family protein [Deltaproteobacteria bacterium]MBM4324460.1 SGNH/GDSL hydrolase family protein [Deltaproteobacteria bacterium]MBM4347841.1 SGNH/GDSL hydrolase family protein [Deltaproteobacteria bacterium]
MPSKVVRICYFGDSITYGLGHDQKGVDMTRRWTALVDEALKKYESGGLFVYSLNLGENGNTTRNGLERLPEAYAFKPDLVTVQFGMNDCNYWFSDGGLPRVNPVSFKFNLKELIEKLFAAKVQKVLLSTNHLIPVEKMMLNNKSYNENNRFYNQIIREIAKDTGVTLCDMESLLADSINNRALFLDENGRWLHLSSLGNQRYAEAILPFIEKELMEIVG